ncbi:MAG: hypothetical protein LBK60_06720 [Verrucomicrobiales bacterium]|nr:hypothetical protein [Verrucomicrobiales bacterium]
MLKKMVRLGLGINSASIIRGLRFGWRDFISSVRSSLSAAHPLEKREHRSYRPLLEAIPVIPLDKILGDHRIPVRLTAERYEDGMLPLYERLVLLSVLILENPREVLEVGTFMGYTAKAMAENLPDAVIHTVDLPPDFNPEIEREGMDNPMPKDDFHLIKRRQIGREFKNTPHEKSIVQHLGDTATLDFSNIGTPTFFFIDGSHTYEYCKNDSEKCLIVSGGRGVFLWHDCDLGHPGVLRFIHEWRGCGRDIRRIDGTAIAYWKEC